MTTPFAPESAPVAGAEPQAAAGAPEGAQPGTEGAQPTTPAGADPRVLEQMQTQMSQFGGQLEQMAQYMPALQQIAGQQGGGGEPTLEDQFAEWFGMEPNGGFEQQPGVPGDQRYDPYTGEPIQQQQPRYDPYTGEPLQPQGQQQVGPFQGDPGEFVQMMRGLVQQEMAPIHERESQRQWDALYEEIPAMNDEQQAPQIAAQVAQAARLFGRDEADARRLANNAGFARFVYMSSVNQQRGEGETPAGAGDGITPIESGSSTSVQQPAGGDPGDAIVNAGNANGGNAGSHFR